MQHRKWNGEERRASKRYGVKDSALRYNKTGWKGWISGKSDRLLLLNLSETGCHFICQEELQPGSQVHVELTAPVVDSAVKLSAEIIWSQLASIESAWKAGLQFQAVSKQNLLKLRHMVNSSVLERIDITTTFYFIESNKIE